MLDSATQPRARRVMPWTAILCIGLNIALAAVVGWVFVCELRYPGGRAPAGFIVGVPVFVLQVLCGLIPARLIVRRHDLVGAARWWLLVPAIGGLCVSAAAAVFSLLTFGGC